MQQPYEAWASMQAHRPYSLRRLGDRAILFVHGILGSPNQFLPIAQHLFSLGYSCFAIQLPGHGGSAKEFLSKGKATWRARVAQALEQLHGQYDNVFLMGHSMGGLLCLEQAYSQGARGIITLNTPMRVQLGPLHLLRAGARGLLGKDCAPSYTARDPRANTYGIQKGRWYHTALLPYRLADVLHMIPPVRRMLPALKAPVLILQSKMDETVHPSSAIRLQKGLQNARTQLAWLPTSKHAQFSPSDVARILQISQNFLSDCLNK